LWCSLAVYGGFRGQHRVCRGRSRWAKATLSGTVASGNKPLAGVSITLYGQLRGSILQPGRLARDANPADELGQRPNGRCQRGLEHSAEWNPDFNHAGVQLVGEYDGALRALA